MMTALKSKKSPRFKLLPLLVLTAAVMVQSVPVAFAGAGNRYACWTSEDTPQTLWRKGGRGITNLGLGWLELINQPIYLSDQGNRLPIAIAGGILKGAVFTVVRAVTGVYEVLTFPFPIPWGYRPILYPEFPLPGTCDKATYD